MTDTEIGGFVRRAPVDVVADATVESREAADYWARRVPHLSPGQLRAVSMVTFEMALLRYGGLDLINR